MFKKFLATIAIFALIIFVVLLFVKNILPTASTVILHRSQGLLQTNGKTNILLLGIGGANHDGPNLTDTIMIASIDVKNNTVTFISVPRDLWVQDVGNNGGKINEAYADGQLNNQHKGLTLAKTIVGKIVNQPIHYGFRIDFNGFVKAIDLLGGIDVHVANTLDDYHYPIDGKEEDICGHSIDEITTFSASPSSEMQQWDFFSCRYMHLHVNVGVQHMDGVTALSFVRSRHGEGSEGTDFARSRRQQLVIEAFREKLLSAGTLFNPGKLIGLYGILKDSIDTDIPQSDLASFISLAQKLKTAHIVSTVIDYGDAATNRPGLLVEGPTSSVYGYAFILLPRVGDGNFSEIQQYVACEIEKGNCSVSQTPITPMPTK